MPRRDTVRLYSDDVFQRHISPAEAEQGIADGSLEPVFEQRGASFRQIGVQRRQVYRSSAPTPAYITAAESQINAIGKRLRQLGESLVPGEKERFSEAELKIRMWPKVRDRKAEPTVIRDVAGPFCSLPLPVRT